MGVETNYQPTQQPTTNNAQDEEFSEPRISQHCPGQARPWSCSSWRPSCCPPSTSYSPSCRPPSTSYSQPCCPPSTSYSPPCCPRSPAHAPPRCPPRCPAPPACPPQPGSPCGGQGGPEDHCRVGGVRAQVLHPAGRSEGCRPGGDSQRRGGLHCVRPHQ